MEFLNKRIQSEKYGVGTVISIDDSVFTVEFENETRTGKSNGSNKSPKTGAAVSAVAASVALAGAGFAVLAASKKKDAE